MKVVLAIGKGKESMFKGGKIPTLNLDIKNAHHEDMLKLDGNSEGELKAEYDRMKEELSSRTKVLTEQIEELVFSFATDYKMKYAYLMYSPVEVKEEADGFSMSATANLFPSDEPDLQCAMKFMLEPIRAYIEASGKRYWGMVKHNQAEMIDFIKVWNESHLEREQKQNEHE